MKKYYGLNAEFVPYNVANVLTASPSSCIIISVQYYVGDSGSTECVTDVYDGSGEGLNYNWNSRPNGA